MAQLLTAVLSIQQLTEPVASCNFIYVKISLLSLTAKVFEGEAGMVWLVPSFMKGQQKLVNALLASLSIRLPVPNISVGEGEGEAWITGVF